MDADARPAGSAAQIGLLRGPLALAIACFVVWGFAYGLLDVLNKHVQETLHVGKAQSTWLQMAYFGAYLLISLPAGLLLQARGYKAGLVSCLVLTALRALLFIPAAHPASFPYFLASILSVSTGGPPRRPHFVLGVGSQALYIGAQVGIGAFFINLVTETWPGLSSRAGAFMLSIATAGYLVGRFATTGLLLRFRPRAVLTTYGLVNVALCLVVAAGLERVSAIALIAVFFFMSTMFATVFTLGVADLGPATKRGASLMVMAIG